MLNYGFPKKWSTLKKLIWLRGNPATGGGDPLITLSGSLVRFTSSKSKPFVSTEVNIVPQQDLHGQSSPYPSGGGKNKWLPITDQTVSNVAISWQSDGGVKLNGLCDASANATVSATLTSGVYTLSCGFSGTLPSEGTSRVQLYSSGASAAIPNNASQTSYQTITVAEDASFQFRIRLAGGFNYQNVILYPQLESGSSRTSFAPYSNICPISGWDAVKVTRTGKNLLYLTEYHNAGYHRSAGYDLKTTDAGATATQNGNVITITSTSNNRGFVLVTDMLQSGSYYVHIGTTTDYTYRRATVYITDKNLIVTTLVASFADRNSSVDRAVTLTEPARIAVYYGVSLPTGESEWSVTAIDSQVELGSSFTEWSAYNGNTYTIQLGDTVYGGTLTINEDGSGELTITKAKADLDKLSFTQYGSSLIYYTAIADKKVGNENFISNMFFVNAVTIANMSDGGMRGYSSNGNVYFCKTDCATATDFTAFVNENKPYIVYELATPITISLTAQQINTLVGENNVWADAGDIEVTVYGTEIVEPDLNALQSLNILLGNRYVNTHEADEPTDEEALDIILGGNER